MKQLGTKTLGLGKMTLHNTTPSTKFVGGSVFGHGTVKDMYGEGAQQPPDKPEWHRTPWWVIYRYFGYVWRIRTSTEPYDPPYRHQTKRGLAKEFLAQKFDAPKEDRSHLFRGQHWGPGLTEQAISRTRRGKA